MDALTSLCRVINQESLGYLSSASTAHPLPRFDRLLWTVYRHVAKATDQWRVGGSSTATIASDGDSVGHGYRVWQRRLLQDFFVLGMEAFVGRYYASLAKLSLADRKLVLSVKYRLSFALQTAVPATAGGIAVPPTTTIGRDSAPDPHGLDDDRDDAGGRGDFARIYFTVATVVPCVGDDYRKVLSGNQYHCTCPQKRRAGEQDGSCQYCTRQRAQCQTSPVNAFLATAAEPVSNPFDPPNPYAFVKLHALSATVSPTGVSDAGAEVDGSHAAAPTSTDGGGCSPIPIYRWFRRQTRQCNLDSIVKRVRCGPRDDTEPPRLEKFRAGELPASLQPDCLAGSLNEPVGDDPFSSQAATHQIWERDLGSLLSHFTINWAKLHYLEPCIIPQHGDR